VVKVSTYVARNLALLLLAVLLGLAKPARAQEPYIVGSEDDPRAGEVDTREQVVHARATLLRTLHYSDHFAVKQIALSPDGQELAAVTRASREGVKAWETATGLKLQLPPTPATVGAVAYSHDMGMIAVTVPSDLLDRDAQGGLFLYDMKSGRLIESIAGGEEARSLAFSPDGSMVMASDANGLLSWQLGEHQAELGRSVSVRGGADWLSFASDRSLYVGASGGGLVLEVSLPEEEIVKSWRGVDSKGSVAISPDGSLVARSEGSTLEIHRLRGGGDGVQSIEVKATISSLSWGASGGLLAAGTTNGDILLYSLEGVSGLPSQARGSPATKTRKKPRSDSVRVARPPRDSRSSPERETGDKHLRGYWNRNTPRPAGPAPLGRREQVVAEFEIRIVEQNDSDPRTVKSMEKNLRSRSKKLAGCWNKALRKGQPVAGRLVLEMGISPLGEGRATSASTEDTIGNDDLHLCIVNRLRGELFGPGLDSAEIELTLRLRVVSPP